MLKVLMLRTKIDKAKKALEALREKDAELETREAQIAQSIEEAASLEGTEKEIREAQSAVEEAAEAFDAEKKDHEAAKEKLESDISEMEAELEKEEAAQNTEPAAEVPAGEERHEGRTITMSKRAKFFGGLSMQERAALFDREEVRSFMQNFRGYLAKEQRGISGGSLLIPEVFIGLLKENVERYSKLYSHVNVQSVSGKGREVVQGIVNEAIWTECCAVLNEMNLAFNDVETDCYKVGAFFKVCNALLEDSDIDLASALLDAMSQGIGIAVDKAILYGQNSDSTKKMPLGVLTRLAQTSKPADYPATARPWVDLHATNIQSIAANTTGAALFKAITLASANMKSRYSRGEKVWVMNDTTYTKLMAETVSTDSAGRIVTGVSDVMPVVGGVIEVLSFIPDNVIIGGFFDLYLLAERGGEKFAESEHAFFLQDATAFKGTARYDGQPVIAEAFIAIGLEGTTPAADSVSFAPDAANTVNAVLLNAYAKSIEVNGTFQIVATTLPVEAPVTFASSDATKATVSDTGLIKAKASGSATITVTSGGASATVAVTVPA